MDKNAQPHSKTTVVVCPANELPAEVSLDQNLLLESCSRWPEVEDCARECTPQVQFSSECLEDFAALHQGEPCTCCGAVLTRDDWYNNRLGALRHTAGAPTPHEVAQAGFVASEEKKSPLCSACYSASYKYAANSVH